MADDQFHLSLRNYARHDTIARMYKLEEKKPDVYERALAKAALLTAYATRPGIGEAITLLRALLVKETIIGNRSAACEEVRAALAAFVGDTHA